MNFATDFDSLLNPEDAGQNGSTSSVFESHHLHSKITPQDRNTYILDMTLNDTLDPTIAVSLSSRDIKLYNAERLISVATLSGHEKTITGIKFSSEDPCYVLSSSLDGHVRIFDIRQKTNPVQTFSDDTDGNKKPLTSFDYSLDESFICAGSELIREDAFLLFWDKRASQSLGGYWNSHTDDITQVHYHPYKHGVLISGSVDGLINLFDLNEECEEKALIQTFNTGSSVEKLRWNAKKKEDLTENQLACITHTGELMLWNTDKASANTIFDKDSMQKASNSDTKVDYLIDTFQKDGQIYLASGFNGGSVQIWTIDDETRALRLWTILEGIHNEVVRAIWFNPQDRTIITGGEDGNLCFWKKDSTSASLSYKMTSHLKNTNTRHSAKPY